MSDKKVESDPTWFKATWPHRRFPSYPFTFLLHYHLNAYKELWKVVKWIPACFLLGPLSMFNMVAKMIYLHIHQMISLFFFK